MSYLLGFPTPVVEAFLALVVLFLIASVYLGVRMEGTRDVRRRDAIEEAGAEEAGTEERGSEEAGD